ncbi:MAG: Substrate-specific component TrpP of tryptophan transporter, partial [Haloplasmataceae bacterium]|nr:Substrate-specific component TrpP of tryptophan transporter [Haloplasmataceae bacterium]
MRSFYLRNMNITALLLSIGLVFHAVVPPFFFGVKPDFILSFMFIAFLLNAKYTNAFLIGVAGGILSGLTTSLPGGFFPNVIDKIITMNVVFVLYTVLNSIFKNIIKARFDQNFIIAPILSLIGTIISGTVFLLS